MGMDILCAGKNNQKRNVFGGDSDPEFTFGLVL